MCEKARRRAIHKSMAVAGAAADEGSPVAYGGRPPRGLLRGADETPPTSAVVEPGVVEQRRRVERNQPPGQAHRPTPPGRQPARRDPNRLNLKVDQRRARQDRPVRISIGVS